jgi:hypothetical protein
MPTTAEIVESIESRLRNLNAEIETLAAARAALDSSGDARRVRQRPKAIVASGGQAPHASAADGNAQNADATARESRRASAPPAQRAVRRSERRRRDRKSGRSVEVVAAGKLELLLSRADGVTTSELAEQANGDRDQVLVLLRELEAAGRVRRSGQRRSTRWHAITDEERMQQRAAELTALSKPTA